jgi:hypothetical protein
MHYRRRRPGAYGTSAPHSFLIGQHNLLAPIYGWFTEGFDTPVQQEAKALLDQLA